MDDSTILDKIGGSLDLDFMETETKSKAIVHRTEMSPQEQRIKMAEASGYKVEADLRKRSMAMTRIYLPDGRLGSQKAGNDQDAMRLALDDCVPDYLNDLNAMNEAEKALTDIQFIQYAYHLSNAAASFRVDIEAVAMSLPILRHNLVSAPAAQRAEAFLRTIGKWVE